MKSIKQIFENNKDLLQNKSVIELINYCKDLEDNLIEKEQVVSFESKLIFLINEIKDSVDLILEDNLEYKRFNEIDKPDFESAFVNLKKYLNDFSKDNNFYYG